MERDEAAIGRPARVPGITDEGQGCQLDLTCAIGVGHPDLGAARTVGHEGSVGARPAKGPA